MSTIAVITRTLLRVLTLLPVPYRSGPLFGFGRDAEQARGPAVPAVEQRADTATGEVRVPVGDQHAPAVDPVAQPADAAGRTERARAGLDRQVRPVADRGDD